MIENHTQDSFADYVLGLDGDQVEQAIYRLGHDQPCACCQESDWVLAMGNDKPCIVNLSLANIDGMALWQYCLLCSHCGLTKLIAAATVAKEVKRKEANDDNQ